MTRMFFKVQPNRAGHDRATLKANGLAFSAKFGGVSLYFYYQEGDAKSEKTARAEADCCKARLSSEVSFALEVAKGCTL